jgi:hypothetical protein
MKGTVCKRSGLVFVNVTADSKFQSAIFGDG